MNISDKIKEIKAELPPQTELVAISKFHPAEAILEAYNAGQRLFGESREQELEEKYKILPKDIKWHFIGHLQTNKVKFIVPYISMIHSVDSTHLLDEIDKQASKIGRKIDCLLEIHIAKEVSKFGFDLNDVRELFNSNYFDKYKNIQIRGLMAMATNSDNEELVRNEFHSVSTLFYEIKNSHCEFNTLSMGMTADWKIAIEEGSTLIRIGSYIFGERIY